MIIIVLIMIGVLGLSAVGLALGLRRALSQLAGAREETAEAWTVADRYSKAAHTAQEAAADAEQQRKTIAGRCQELRMELERARAELDRLADEAGITVPQPEA